VTIGLRERDAARLASRRLAVSGVLAGALVVTALLSGCSSSNPAGPEPSRMYLVDLSGAGDFLTIQEGLNVASDADTVLIAPGTYTGPGNKNLTFPGTSPTVSGAATRDETVIDCEGSGRAFYIGGDSSPLIENVTITGGDTLKGGGMYLEGSSATLRNVQFLENEAGSEGGGLYCHEGSPALEDVRFESNTSTVDGGGILCVGASPSINSATFVDNTAVSGGGVACIFSTPVLSECVFWQNHAVFGGAIYCGGSDPAITSCTVVANEGSQGSGVYCADNSSASIRRTIIAFGQPGEGVVCVDSAPYTTLSCVFENGEMNEICGDYTTSMVYEDPVFCDAYYGDLTLAADSPCLPDNNVWSVLIGALDQGCDEPRRRTGARLRN
jgi:predicted outer membrane repeat protein